MKKKYTPWLVLLGFLFLTLGGYYWSTKANALPHWFPGYDAGENRKHFKHGLASILLGLGCFVWAWFSLGAKDTMSVQNKDSE